MSEAPIACILTDAELRERRTGVLARAARAVLETREEEDGYAFRFPSNGQTYAQVVQLLGLERKCCPFLRFRITAEPGGGPLWLGITGPWEVKEFARALFDTEA